MNLDRILINNTKNAKSLTASAFFYGFIITMLKLAVSNMVIGSVAFGGFSGAECAAVLGALGVIYTLRRNKDDELAKDNKK